jgi:hypothetical protein
MINVELTHAFTTKTVAFYFEVSIYNEVISNDGGSVSIEDDVYTGTFSRTYDQDEVMRDYDIYVDTDKITTKTLHLIEKEVLKQYLKNSQDESK